MSWESRTSNWWKTHLTNRDPRTRTEKWKIKDQTGQGPTKFWKSGSGPGRSGGPCLQIWNNLNCNTEWLQKLVRWRACSRFQSVQIKEWQPYKDVEWQFFEKNYLTVENSESWNKLQSKYIKLLVRAGFEITTEIVHDRTTRFLSWFRTIC